MAQVFVVRHGQTQGNLEGLFCGHSETLLTGTGRAQATALGVKLAQTTFDAAYASDLSRAGETARLVLAENHAPPPLRIDARLREQHYGEWEALPASKLRETYPELMLDFMAARVHGLPGGETITMVRERMAASVREAVSMHPSGTILVVTHGGAIAALFAELLSVPIETTWSFAVDNASVSRVFLTDERVLVLSMNETSHIEHIEGPALLEDWV